MTQLSTQYAQVKEQLKQACANFNRSPQDVCLLAVSKRHSLESIRHIYDLGQRAFGENYVQEGVEKAQALNDLNIEWHFIGPIQSNKSKPVAEHFHWVHTLDREKIATRLNEQRPNHLGKLNVLIQVNISHQESKSGISLEAVDTLASHISELPNLCLRGLMCIPAPQDQTNLQNDFLNMHAAFIALQKQYSTVDTLSMGMSQDLDLAVASGSTMVRIGTAIFGQRDS
jgi:pyridoxal phosphate enzyme (YggS family)